MKDRIKRIRKDAKITLDVFGSRIGISGPAVSQIENGKTTPSPQTISSICREFNVSEDWLRTGDGEMYRQLSMDEQIIAWVGRMQLSEDVTFQKRVALALAQMTDQGWEELEKLARRIIERD